LTVPWTIGFLATAFGCYAGGRLAQVLCEPRAALRRPRADAPHPLKKPLRAAPRAADPGGGGPPR
jgi:hypothetical protein